MFTPKSNLLAGRRGGSRSNTPLSGSRRTPLLASRARGNHGTTPVSRTNVIEDTGSHVLASFGTPLPVLVTEVLTLASAAEVSVSLGENGWAWLVTGRRLVIWRYTGGGRAQCRELSLPASDLKHKSDLCAVYSMAAGQTPCCLAVSPEGIVRFWPSIVHEGSSTEISADLGGQECVSLTTLLPVGCVLSTTTSTLVLIHHVGQGVACKQLQTSTNLLSGFGRRVSSLLWSGMGTSQSEAKLIRVVGTKGREFDNRVLMVLTATGLQKWVLEDADTARQVYEVDVTDIARESMWEAMSREGAEGKSAWLKIWTLDISMLDDQLIMLVAGVNTNQAAGSSYKVYYGVMTVRIITDTPPMRAEDFLLTSHTSLISEGGEPLPMRMLRGEGGCHLLSDLNIIILNLKGEGEQGKMGLGAGDAILGTGVLGESSLLFTRQYGVISLTPSQKVSGNESVNLNDTSLLLDKSATKLSDSLNISVSAQGLDNLTMSESKTDQLKAAFLLFCKRSVGQAQGIVEELFPNQSSEPLDSTLDRLVLSLSKDLIDDFPASDPRWMESLPASQVPGTGSSMSLLVLHQLEDKLTCHELFITFLKNIGLFNRLSAVKVRAQPTPTVSCLAEHNEKNIAAVTLRTIHNDFLRTMDACVRMCLEDREITATGNLTPQDHFYREISRIDDILDSFVTFIQHSARSESARELAESILSVNAIVITVIKAVLINRNKQVAEFTPTGYAASLEYLPWTATRRPQLTGLFKLSLQHGLKAAEDGADRGKMHQQLLDLADIILDGYRSQLGSLEGEAKRELTGQFERAREDLITPLVDLRLYNEAASLAEKYLEFGALVRICEESGNKEKLEEYTNMFSAHNFSEFVFTWYVKEGKQSRLLSATGRSNELGRFLSGHTDISWLHDIHTENVGKAAATLADIATKESDILARKKVQLSLAKLCQLAGEVEDPLLQSIEEEIMLVNAQEQIPAGVVEQFGFDKANMRVFTPREMIEMYIGEENRQADSVEFIKALDLLNFVQLEQEEKDKVRMHIWCQSILRDSWQEIDTNNPIQSVKETVFFKLIEYGFLQGYDLDSFLPSPESILSQGELGTLKEEKNFQYLLQTGYEHVQRVCAM